IKRDLCGVDRPGDGDALLYDLVPAPLPDRLVLPKSRVLKEVGTTDENPIDVPTELAPGGREAELRPILLGGAEIEAGALNLPCGHVFEGMSGGEDPQRPTLERKVARH